MSRDFDADDKGDLETLDLTASEAPTRNAGTDLRLPRPARWLPPVIAAAAIGAIAVIGAQGHPSATRGGIQHSTADPTSTTPPTLPRPIAVERELRPGEQRCPADEAFALSLAHETVADMKLRGAADTLSEYGATTLARVVAAARGNGAQIRRSQRDVIAITVGPGVGWTFSQRPDSSIEYHQVDDFQVVVHLGAKAVCPRYPSFVGNDHGQRVPSLYVYGSHP